jgi:hypothetical protein
MTVNIPAGSGEKRRRLGGHLLSFASMPRSEERGMPGLRSRSSCFGGVGNGEESPPKL